MYEEEELNEVYWYISSIRVIMFSSFYTLRSNELLCYRVALHMNSGAVATLVNEVMCAHINIGGIDECVLTVRISCE